MPPTATSVLHSCSVCLENTVLSDVRWTICGHGFCNSCVDLLFGIRARTSCPECRNTISRSSLHQIYLHAEVKRPSAREPRQDQEMKSLKKLVEDLSRENESLQDESGHLRREVYDIQQSRDADRRSIMKLTEHKRVLLAALTSIQQERESQRVREAMTNRVEDRLEYLDSLTNLIEHAHLRKRTLPRTQQQEVSSPSPPPLALSHDSGPRARVHSTPQSADRFSTLALDTTNRPSTGSRFTNDHFPSSAGPRSLWQPALSVEGETNYTSSAAGRRAEVEATTFVSFLEQASRMREMERLQPTTEFPPSDSRNVLSAYY